MKQEHIKELLEDCHKAISIHKPQLYELLADIHDAIAALGEKAPEPVAASGLDAHDYWVVADTEVEYAVPDGYERETLKAGSRVWLARWTEDQLEAARRSAEELHRKLHAAPPPASPEWARKLEEQAANVIAWSCRLEAEQGPQAKCLEWCRDKRRCTASFASPPWCFKDGP